jgi:hypothetical protein
MNEWEIALQALIRPPTGHKNDPSLLADLLRSGKTPPPFVLWSLAELLDPQFKPEKDPGAADPRQASVLFDSILVVKWTGSSSKSIRKLAHRMPVIAAMAARRKSGETVDQAAVGVSVDTGRDPSTVRKWWAPLAKYAPEIWGQPKGK